MDDTTENATSPLTLTIESLAMALVETRVESLARHNAITRGLNGGKTYRVFCWADLCEGDREIARTQARLIFERIMR